MHHTIALIALLLAGAAQAQQFYRCTDSAGKVLLSDKACDNSAVDASRFVLKPNTLDSRESRAQDLRQENQRLREQLQDQRQSGGQRQQFGRTEADLQSERSSSLECRQATRNLEVATSSRTPGGTSRRSAEQSMRVACGMREPVVVERDRSPAICHPIGGGMVQCN